MQYEQIKVEKSAGIIWLELHRPDKMNALTPRMLEEWKHALENVIDDDSVRVVVVTGTGKAWSAGVDLSLFQEIKVEPGNPMYELGNDIMNMMQKMPQVSIAMVNGYCFTGALELMLAFDLVICADEAKIGDTHAKWGIPPKWGMTQRLMQQIGMRKAMEMSFTAKTISGKEAEALGLANYSVPLSELGNFTEKLAQSIIANSGQAVAAIKQLYYYGAHHSLQEGLEYERNLDLAFTDKKDELKDFKNRI